MGPTRQLADVPDAQRAGHEGDLRHERHADGRHQGGTLRNEADGDCRRQPEHPTGRSADCPDGHGVHPAGPGCPDRRRVLDPEAARSLTLARAGRRSSPAGLSIQRAWSAEMMWSVRQTAVKTMVHAARMAATGDRLESARSRAIAAIDDYAAEMRRVDGTRLGQGLIETRALKDRVEAVFAEGLP